MAHRRRSLQFKPREPRLKPLDLGLNGLLADALSGHYF